MRASDPYPLEPPFAPHDPASEPCLVFVRRGMALLPSGFTGAAAPAERSAGVFCLGPGFPVASSQNPGHDGGQFHAGSLGLSGGGWGLFFLWPWDLSGAGKITHRKWRTGRRGRRFCRSLIGWALLVRLNVELRGTDEKMYRWALHFTTPTRSNTTWESCFFRPGGPKKRCSTSRDVYSVYPENADNTHALAIALWQSGHHKPALRLLESLVKANPAYRPAQKACAS